MCKKGFKLSEETKDKLRKAQIGRKHSEETKRKMSKAHKKFWTSEKGKKAKEKISERNRRREVSKETRRKMSLSQRKPNASYIEFVKFALNQVYIARSGLVMANIARKFLAINKLESNKRDRYEAIGVFIRVYLEMNSYINYAPLNSLNRSIKFISVTPEFPKDKAELESLMNEVSYYVYYRNRQAKQRSKQNK